MKTIQVIGHRGAAAVAPENTWESFEAALDAGVEAIETDVRATRDGVLVLMHDESLDRTTDGAGHVQETPWSVVHTLDAGAWFGEAFCGARVPHLYETLVRYGSQTHLVLEIKQPGIVPDVLDMVRALDLGDRVTFTSFDFLRATKIKTLAPWAKVGFLTSNLEWSHVTRTADADLDQYCPPAANITRRRVSDWKTLGLEIRAWGVKNRDLMVRAIQAKVDGMTVDSPRMLQRLLRRHQWFG